MNTSSEYRAEMQAAAAYVRDHPGCIQSNVIEHTMNGRSFGYARDRIKATVKAGMIVERRQRNRLYLYPPGGAPAAGNRP